jgi:hypothetical protein
MKTQLVIAAIFAAVSASAQVTTTTEACKKSEISYGVGKVSNETCVNVRTGEVRNTTCVSGGVEAGGKTMGVGASVGAEVRTCTEVKERPAREPRERVTREPVERPVREPREPREPRERPSKD